jgi:hypothetical protein
LFWQDWFWPGILILIGISGIFKAIARMTIKPTLVSPTEQDFQTTNRPNFESPAQFPSLNLPSRCPNCGAPVTSNLILWSEDRKFASCAYCKSNIGRE